MGQSSYKPQQNIMLNCSLFIASNSLLRFHPIRIIKEGGCFACALKFRTRLLTFKHPGWASWCW